jgi:CheY-like chemotaxis protein
MSNWASMHIRHKAGEKTDERLFALPTSRPVLIVEDRQKLVEQLSATLEGAGYPVVCGDPNLNLEYLLASGVGSKKIAGIVVGSRKLAPARVSGKKFLLSKRIVFLQKPFSRKRLLAAVREVIGKPSPTQRILSVDDFEPIREILATTLGFSGYRCRTAAGGMQALKLLQSGEKFDLITSDIVNSPMDGIEFLQQIRRRFPNIPVLMLTATRDISLALSTLRNGAYGCLVKPLDREQLIFAVQRALEFRRLKLENRSLQRKLARLTKRKSARGRA